jgi:hypothetical protein
MWIFLSRLWLRIHPHWWSGWRYYRRRMLHHSDAGYTYGMELWMRERQCRVCGRVRIEREQQRRSGRLYKDRPHWVPYTEQWLPRRPGEADERAPDA